MGHWFFIIKLIVFNDKNLILHVGLWFVRLLGFVKEFSWKCGRYETSRYTLYINWYVGLVNCRALLEYITNTCSGMYVRHSASCYQNCLYSSSFIIIIFIYLIIFYIFFSDIYTNYYYYFYFFYIYKLLLLFLFLLYI